jgi:hypothetical protein
MIILFIVILVLVIVFWKNQNEYAFYYAPSVKPAPKKCSKSCPKNFKPVYDTTGKQYANSCQFEIAKCKNPKLELRGVPKNAPGKTTPKKCNDKCPMHLRPVYDTSGKQYANSCQFEIAKCHNPKLELRGVSNNAPGKTTPRKPTTPGKTTPKKNMAPSEECKKNCKPSAQPQYDTDGNFYINDCFFAYAKCKNPKKVYETYDCVKNNCSNKTTPVCDDKGKKYSNVCEFLKETCKGNRIVLTPCPDAPVCEDVNSQDSTCKQLPDCAPTDMDKLLPEYCEMNSGNSQTCVYVNNGKACRTVISPKKFNNEETKIKVSEIIKNAQPPELDIQIFPFVKIS